MKRKQIAVILASVGVLGLLTLAALRVLDPARGERRAGLTGAPMASPRSISPTGVSGPSETNAPANAETLLARHRSLILSSRYGTAPSREVLRELSEATGGPDVQLIFQALALRKNEALPVVRERLRAGAMYETHLLPKFLRLCPWPETKPELLALAGESGEQWLPRQGRCMRWARLETWRSVRKWPGFSVIRRAPTG